MSAALPGGLPGGIVFGAVRRAGTGVRARMSALWRRTARRFPWLLNRHVWAAVGTVLLAIFSVWVPQWLENRRSEAAFTRHLADAHMETLRTLQRSVATISAIGRGEILKEPLTVDAAVALLADPVLPRDLAIDLRIFVPQVRATEEAIHSLNDKTKWSDADYVIGVAQQAHDLRLLADKIATSLEGELKARGQKPVRSWFDLEDENKINFSGEP